MLFDVNQPRHGYRLAATAVQIAYHVAIGMRAGQGIEISLSNQAARLFHNSLHHVRHGGPVFQVGRIQMPATVGSELKADMR